MSSVGSGSNPFDSPAVRQAMQNLNTTTPQLASHRQNPPDKQEPVTDQEKVTGQVAQNAIAPKEPSEVKPKPLDQDSRAKKTMPETIMSFVKTVSNCVLGKLGFKSGPKIGCSKFNEENKQLKDDIKSICQRNELKLSNILPGEGTNWDPISKAVEKNDLKELQKLMKDYQKEFQNPTNNHLKRQLVDFSQRLETYNAHFSGKTKELEIDKKEEVEVNLREEFEKHSKADTPMALLKGSPVLYKAMSEWSKGCFKAEIFEFTNEIVKLKESRGKMDLTTALSFLPSKSSEAFGGNFGGFGSLSGPQELNIGPNNMVSLPGGELSVEKCVEELKTLGKPSNQEDKDRAIELLEGILKATSSPMNGSLWSEGIVADFGKTLGKA